MADQLATSSVRTKLFSAKNAFDMVVGEYDDSSNDGESNSVISDYNDSDNDPDYVVQRSSTDSNSDDDSINNSNRPNGSGSADEQHSNDEIEDMSLKKKSRRPTRSPQEWTQNKRKRLRNSGQEYTNKSGKLVTKKTMERLENHKCRLNCNMKISLQERQQIFNAFWDLGSFDAQNSFISGSVTQHKSKRARDRKNQNISRRTSTRVYKLHVKDSIIVCKQMFLATLGISNGRCSRIFETINAQECHVAVPDKRGKHANHKRHNDLDIQDIKDHIQSFPAYASHYSRHKDADSKVYLSPDLNIARMYELYREKQIARGKTPFKHCAYRDIFNHKYNISFHMPRQDTCRTCDELFNKIKVTTEDTSAALKNDLEYHHRVAEKVRSSMTEDKEEAKLDNTKEVFTFDLEKTLPTPRIPTGVAYYKRQLWTYNLGIHSLTSDKGFMFVWHEEAKRGASEVGSCIYTYIKKLCAEGITNITAYSDCCGGQNRNFKIAMFWSHIVSTTCIQEVNHKFMEPGHSFLPNDQDFGIIEKKKLNVETVYTPDCWAKLIANSKKRNPFVVYKMSDNDFKNPEGMKQWMVNRKKDSIGQKVCWLKIKWIKFVKATPFTMFHKNVLNKEAEFNSIEMARYKPTRQRPTPMDVDIGILPQLYQIPPPINPKKYDDLKELMKYVPPIYHDFFTNLRTDNTVTLLHPDDAGLDNESDDEDDVE